MSPERDQPLVIVESPTKARTIAGFLPKGFQVEASVGHIRDLPNNAKEIPAKFKDRDWARLGIDVENDFQPLYVVPSDKKKQVAKLKGMLKKASVLYLATDEDREGEAISWHLLEVLDPDVPVKRLVFHEITRTAIQAALDNPRDLDEGLVQAQETRRLLDRLVGYELSPVLWRKVASGLSAGRVQSVAVRLIVERERERMRFVRGSYWDLLGTFAPTGGSDFQARLVELDGKRVATGRDFDAATGKPQASSDAVLVDEARARKLAEDLVGGPWKVASVDRKPYTDRPQPPFTTSTLQQEANRKLRLSSRQAMQAAQRLYENGLITYMRTDSTTLSGESVSKARSKIVELYGNDYLSEAPRQYKTKVKNAQEAHEAIRPSLDFVTPEQVAKRVGADEARVYELIWKRTMACQMADAKGSRVQVRVGAGPAVLQVGGKTIEFPGFLRAYVEGADDPDAELADKETVLPDVREGDALDCRKLEPEGHTTQPPGRFTEASLVKELEANGVGRPSTYASIIETIVRREYVVKQRNALVPTFTAFAVTGLLEQHFANLVDVAFTARMEDDLDEISLGHKQALPYLKEFYFGKEGLAEKKGQEIDAREVCTIPLGVDDKGETVVVRVGRYGPYVQRGEDRATVPEATAPDELTLAKAIELLEIGSGPTEIGVHPDNGLPVHLKSGRYGPYVQLGDREGDEKPKMKSLLPGMAPEEVTLETAVKLLSLPREVGKDPATDEPITTDLGRYGPYLRRGSDTRSLQTPEQIFEIDLEGALAVLAQEKKRGFRSRAAALKEMGKSPDGETVKLMDGRYGPYVTDGTTNASLPKGSDPDELTLERALELIAERAAKGPSRKKKKKAAKKASKKKAGKKKATKKTTKKAAKKATKKASKKAGKAVSKKASEDADAE